MDSPRVTTAERPAASPPPVAPAGPLARASTLPWLLFLVALAALAWLAWHVYGPNGRQDPSGIGAVALEKQNRLVVLKARLSTVTVTTDKRWFGLLKSVQIAVIPATVDYSLDLSKVGKDRLTWSAKNNTLNVQLPSVQVGRPNLDVERARYFREGTWITGDAQEELYKKNAEAARRQAIDAAGSSAYVTFAQSAAKDAVRQNLAIPLQVAGFGDVKVAVRFDGETKPVLMPKR